jgi:hypothetical protein
MLVLPGMRIYVRISLRRTAEHSATNAARVMAVVERLVMYHSSEVASLLISLLSSMTSRLIGHSGQL